MKDTSKNQFHLRVKWWSVLALLRSLASSPAAAAATLRNRSETVDAETPEEAAHEIEHWFGKTKAHQYKRFGVDE